MQGPAGIGCVLRHHEFAASLPCASTDEGSQDDASAAVWHHSRRLKPTTSRVAHRLAGSTELRWPCSECHADVSRGKGGSSGRVHPRRRCAIGDWQGRQVCQPGWRSLRVMAWLTVTRVVRLVAVVAAVAWRQADRRASRILSNSWRRHSSTARRAPSKESRHCKIGLQDRLWQWSTLLRVTGQLGAGPVPARRVLCASSGAHLAQRQHDATAERCKDHHRLLVLRVRGVCDCV